MMLSSAVQQRPSDTGNDLEFALLNESYYKSPASRNPSLGFTVFSRLPTEIRCQVWELLVPNQRLLTIVIEPVDVSPAHDDKYTSTNQLGNVISGAGYCLRLKTSHYISPLLNVSRESRQVLIRHYRVHIPTQRAGSCFMFRPESDIIHVGAKEGSENLLADFIHDARAYDAKGHGILNIAIGGYVRIREMRLPRGKYTSRCIETYLLR